MFQTIVWATDGTAAAQRGLMVSRRLSKEHRAKLIVVHVAELISSRTGLIPRYVVEPDLEARIAADVEHLRSEGIDTERITVRAALADVASVIADAARSADADLIVLSTRGRSPIVGLAFGSVAQRLLHVASCPVLAIPETVSLVESGVERETRAAA